jgi:hypothetical protein
MSTANEGVEMMSKLLFDEQPIVVSKTLAKLIGLNEAIVLQQVHYWIEINKKANKNFYDGRYWTYNSIRSWQEDNFEFWSFNTVQRTFAKLESLKLLISGNFNKDPRDKTKWYTIDYEVLETLTPITPKWGKHYTKMGQAYSQNDAMQDSKMGQALPEISSETSTEISRVSQSVKEETEQTDGQTDVKQKEIEDYHRILAKCHLEFFDCPEAIRGALEDMYFGGFAGRCKKPKEIVRGRMRKLDANIIEYAIDKMEQSAAAGTDIKSSVNYLQTCIYNGIAECEGDIIADEMLARLKHG